MKELYKAFKIQLRVVYALMMREIITRYGRENIGFLWLFLEPLVLILGVTLLWSYIRPHKEYWFPVQVFIFTGWMVNKLWMITVPKAMQGIHANIGLLYHRYITPFDIILSRIVLEVTAMTGVFMFLSFILISVHIIEHPYNYFYIVIGWILACWFTFGFSFLVTSINILTNDLLQKIWSLISLALFISSGTFFLVEWLPPEVRPYVLLLPTVHNVEMVRYGFFGNKMHPYFDVAYSLQCNLFITFLGLFLFKIQSKKILIE
ncbi:ABC transporter permease [Aquifex sp.]